MKLLNFMCLIILSVQNYASAGLKEEQDFDTLPESSYLENYLNEEVYTNEYDFNYHILSEILEAEDTDNGEYVEYAYLNVLAAKCVETIAKLSLGVSILLVNTCKKFITTYQNRGVNKNGYITVPKDVYFYNIEILRKLEQELWQQCFADFNNVEAPICKFEG